MGQNSLVHSGKRLNRFVDWMSYLYIGLPIVIFTVGWIRWYIAIPAVCLIFYSFYRGLKTPGTVLPSIQNRHRKTIILSLLLILGWVLFSGIGGFTFQNDDHWWRNEIFRLLVTKNWPVMGYNYPTPHFLCYYIGFWMPAALFGKIFGLGAGFIFQTVWALLGVILIWLKLSEFLKRWSLAAVIIFVFFSGLDILGMALKGHDIFHLRWQSHIEWWTSIQFSSHTTQLYWVFNQAIYGWLLTLMILNEKKNSNLILIWSCGLLECTFPFVGMIPFLVYRIFASNQSSTISFKEKIKALFSVQNIIGGGLIGLISFFYIIGNTSAASTGVGTDIYTSSGTESAMVPSAWDFIGNTLLFLTIEVLLYYIIIFRFHRKNPLFYISLSFLILCPFVRVGGGSDFCMRASIPGLLVLCLLVIECFEDAWKKHRLRFFTLLIVLIIGSITPIHEMARGLGQTIDYYRLGRPIMQYIKGDLLGGGNFASDTKNNLFYQYLAK